MRCDRCGFGFLGRVDARFCSTRCRVAWHRSLPRLPRELTGRRAWTRAAGKRPIRIDGSPASSTDPTSWSSWSEVHRSSAGDGFGVMLGEGLACWDLDHCLEGDVLAKPARRVLESLEVKPLWVERSVSGMGLHVFVAGSGGRGFRHAGVEFYPGGRFIRVTGVEFTNGAMS